jgi:hypothetical protein
MVSQLPGRMKGVPNGGAGLSSDSSTFSSSGGAGSSSGVVGSTGRYEESTGGGGNRDPAILPVELRDGVILVGGVALMDGVSPALSRASTHDSPVGRPMNNLGLMLTVDMTSKGSDGPAQQQQPGPARARHDVVVGRVKTNKILACSRIKRWWMAPSWPLQAGEVPIETQFMLVGLADDKFAVLLPLVDGSFRSTLYGTAGRKPIPRQLAGRIWEGIGDALSLRVESGDRSVRSTSVTNALYVAGGTDPYVLLDFAFREVSRQLGTFGVRTDKPVPPLLRKFGWCTWDAFYSNVRPEGVFSGLQALKDGGTPPKFLILDDGWQSVGPPGREDGEAVVSYKDELVEEGGWSSAVVEAPQQLGEAGAPAVGVAEGGAFDTDVAPLTEEELRSTSGTTLTGDVAAHSVDEETSPLMQFLQKVVARLYKKYVEHAEPDSWTVRLWMFVVHKTFLRDRFLEFFHKFTDFSKRLTSFRANKKFEQLGSSGRTFYDFVKFAKESYGIDLVYCWHAMPGYWGGVSLESNETAYLKVRRESLN